MTTESPKAFNERFYYLSNDAKAHALDGYKFAEARIRAMLESEETPVAMMHRYFEETDWSEINHLQGYEREHAELEMVIRGMKAALKAIVEEI